MATAIKKSSYDSLDSYNQWNHRYYWILSLCALWVHNYQILTFPKQSIQHLAIAIKPDSKDNHKVFIQVTRAGSLFYFSWVSWFPERQRTGRTLEPSCRTPQSLSCWWSRISWGRSRWVPERPWSASEIGRCRSRNGTEQTGSARTR